MMDEMVLDQQIEMTASETDTFLLQHESAVLSLARFEEPYAIPISYGYDPKNRRFFMRLVSGPDSDKRRFLTSEPQARLVIYEEAKPIYRSVIASGLLQTISTNELTVERIEQFGRTNRPLFEMWNEPKPDLDIQLYELDPDELSGRMITVEDP